MSTYWAVYDCVTLFWKWMDKNDYSYYTMSNVLFLCIQMFNIIKPYYDAYLFFIMHQLIDNLM